jgi:D-psicose/D-tagatose/L-ribulose 3-epimerase
MVDSPDSFGSFEQFADALHVIKTLGYQGVEINLTGPKGCDVDAVTQLGDDLALPVVSLLTGGNYFRDNLCLVSPKAQTRREAVERLQTYTAIAARFDAVLVVGQMQGFSSDEPNAAEGEARIEAGLREVSGAAEQHGATIVIEPVNHLQVGFHHTLAEVTALIERIGSPHCKPMLDSFHINIEETSPTEPIDRAGPDLAHFHLCETNAGLLGSGHLDIPAIFGALDAVGYQGWISVKSYRHDLAAGAGAAMRHLKSLGLA